MSYTKADTKMGSTRLILDSLTSSAASKKTKTASHSPLQATQEIASAKPETQNMPELLAACLPRMDKKDHTPGG